MSKFLGKRATKLGRATVSGELYDLGMYPGFKTSTGSTVRGELYELDERRAEETMSMINAYESVTGSPEDEYTLEKVACKIGGGEKRGIHLRIETHPRGRGYDQGGRLPRFLPNQCGAPTICERWLMPELLINA